MRIAMIVHQYPPERTGGTERHVRQLARALAREHEVFVYTQAVEHHGTGAAEDAIDGTVVRRWLDRSGAAQPALAKDMEESIRAFAPNVVHVHHAIGFPPRAVRALAADFPSVLTLHDYWWICPRIRLLYRGETPCEGPVPLSRCVSCYDGADAKSLVGEAASLF
ncbi:MAG: glycosyltransferase [Deltaproteobacteria bacterium]|nr:glycosyltransferase [Deltaproteobacteria bacterium]